MDENLVGYLLKIIDPKTQREVEIYVCTHPEARARLERLRQILQPLAVDRDTMDPPPRLVLLTLARVAETAASQRVREDRPFISPAPIPVRETALPRRPWRRADLLVAAILLVLVGGAGLSWLAHLRLGDGGRVECQNNLRLFHQALAAYSQHHGGAFPKVEDHPPRNVAGIFVPILHDAGLLGPDATVVCPSSASGPATRRSLHDLETLPPEERGLWARQLAGSYAYSLGYRDAQDQLHGLRRDPAEANNDLLPILSDRPLTQEEGAGSRGRANSPNHSGGQNLLYIGGHVKFVTTPAVGIDRDDIFLNQAREVAAGLHRWDTVLGVSSDRPRPGY